jgi:uncharacterized membrane protein
MARRTRPRKRPLVERMRKRVRAHLISGMAVIVPLGITAYVIQLCYRFTAGRLSPTVTRVTEEWPSYLSAGFSILLLFVVLYGMGLVATVFIGRHVIVLAESILHRIPLVKSVYGASKQIVETLLFTDGGANFKSVALIEFPRPGMYTLAFVTGTITINGEKRYKIFVPTTPNPTSGYFEIMDPVHVRPSGLSVEEAAKIVMSGGLLAPEAIKGEEGNASC